MERDVLRPCKPGGTRGPAVHAGGLHRVEERPVRLGGAGDDRGPSRVLFGDGCELQIPCRHGDTKSFRLLFITLGHHEHKSITDRRKPHSDSCSRIQWVIAGSRAHRWRNGYPLVRFPAVMSRAKLIGPFARTTPSDLRATLGRARGIPEDLLRQASRRLEILTLLGAVLWLLAPALGHLAATAEPEGSTVGRVRPPISSPPSASPARSGCMSTSAPATAIPSSSWISASPTSWRWRSISASSCIVGGAAGDVRLRRGARRPRRARPRGGRGRGRPVLDRLHQRDGAGVRQADP